MILCVTPNAALDRTLIVPGFRAGDVSRAAQVIVAAGGKGLNVARTVRRLGEEAVCVGFLGGHSGRLFAELAQHEGLKGKWIWIEGETRTCVILVDPESGEASLINEPGPAVSASDWSGLQAEVLRQAASAECVCLCGSLPPGPTPEMFANLICTLLAAGRRVWVDTSGPALRAALAAGPVGVKANSAEASAILGVNAADASTAARAAAELRGGGAGAVALTLGEYGAVLVDDTGSWWARPPALKVVSAIGSGDAFLGGFVTALSRGSPPSEALRRAVAAGAANALSPGGGRFELSDFESILTATSVSAIP